MNFYGAYVQLNSFATFAQAKTFSGRRPPSSIEETADEPRRIGRRRLANVVISDGFLCFSTTQKVSKASHVTFFAAHLTFCLAKKVSRGFDLTFLRPLLISG